jgi:hypothetical protein
MRLRSVFALCALACMLFAGRTAVAQSSSYDDVRSVVQRTQDDLQRVRINKDNDKKQFERVENARRHLSDFDRNLSRNKFDKGRLDEAIEDVQNILDHNTLEPRDRDLLKSDVTELRRVRELRGR